MSNSTPITPQDALAYVKAKAKTMITTTGKIELKVTNDPSVYTNDKGQHIVNLSAMAVDQHAIALQHMRDKEYNKAANVGLSANIFTDAFIPSKGEVVFAQIAYVNNRAGEKVLRVTSITPMPVMHAASGLSAFDEFEYLLEEPAVAATENLDEAG